ncbi:hypothetical protein EON82_09455 [bacterium]|nr:MAG: hypothetical protein EON82_09455 [bacterium]
MSTDVRLLRGLNFMGMAVVAGLIGYVGFVSFRTNRATRSESMVPGLTEYRDSIRRARQAASENRLAEAERHYQEALLLRPETPSAILELAKFYEDHDQLPKAREQYEFVARRALRAVERHNASAQDLKALVSYADVCLKSGASERAWEIFSTVSGDVTAAGGAGTKRSISDLRARSYVRVDRFDDAILINPRLWDAYRLASFSRDPAVRTTWLRRLGSAVKKYPDDPSGPSTYAEALRAMGRGPEALDYLQETSRKGNARTRSSLKPQIDSLRRQIELEAKLRSGDPNAAGAQLPPPGSFGPSGTVGGGSGLGPGFGGPSGP